VLPQLKDRAPGAGGARVGVRGVAFGPGVIRSFDQASGVMRKPPGEDVGGPVFAQLLQDALTQSANRLSGL
jgi:hypothetical protein